MGAIQRSTKSGVNYDANDFVLSVNGSITELVDTDGYNYAAKIEDSFSKIYRDPTTDGFVQTTKDGRKYYFGSTNDSRQYDPNNSSWVFKWCLDKVEDTNGNYMTITYVKDQGQMYLSQIAYTGNGSLLPTNYVNFFLENRTDAPVMYTTNFAVTTAKRLKTIKIYGNNKLAGNYILNYGNSTSTSRSLLASVTQYGSDGVTTLAAVTLKYQEGGRGYTNTIWDGGGITDSGAHWADLNGDGKADYVTASSSGGRHYVSLASGPSPDLLSSVTTPLGATATFTYTPSSTWPRSQTFPNHYVPFILQTVSAITVNDGLGNTSTTQYSYSGGWFDFASREFRGFNQATSTKPDGTIVTTQFHQGDFLKGRQQWVESKNSAGQLLGRDTFIWDTAAAGDSIFVKLSRKVSRLYENGALAVTTQENMTYDDTNGNLLFRTISGPGAEAVTTGYLYQNYGAWLWRPTRETIRGSVSGKVREVYMDYQTGTGNLLYKRFWLNGGANPQVTYEEYDDYGNPTRVRDAKGYLTITEYDPATHTYPAKITNPLKHFVEFAYDQRYGKLDWEKDVNGKLTDYTYDTFGRPVRVNFPNGGQATTQYIEAVLDSQTGAIITPGTTITQVKEDAAGNTIDKHQYVDGLGRPIQAITSGVTAPVVVRSFYDDMGRNYLNQGPFFSSGALHYPMEEPTEYPWQRSYFDDHGRPWKTERPDGVYGVLATTVTYNGLTTTIADADNKKKEETRDYLGRLVTVVEDPDRLSYTTTYDYNAAGNLRHVTDHADSITTINYDTLGRKINMTDPDMGYWVYTYDANGNLWTQTDAKGQTISFKYDAVNRLTTKTYSTGDPTVIYSYDNPQITNGKGKLYSVATSKVTTTYGNYDAMGRARSTTRTITGDKARTTSFTFDLSGKPRTTTYPDGYVVTNSYYPGTGLLWKVTGSDGTVFATYSGHSASGRIGQMDHANDTGTVYTYDAWSGRLQWIVTEDATGLPANDIQRKGYFYTRAGDIDSIEDQKRSITYSYAYDAIHRLTAETNTGGYPANSYTYDAIGNIAFRSMGKFSYTYAYGPGAGPHAVKEIGVNGTTHAFIYDDNGNMTTGRDLENPAQVATRTITYNADNMPTRITHSAKGITDLVYDGAGSRVKKTRGASTTYYIGAHFEVIDGIATKYIFAGNTRVAMVKAGQTLYFHQDHLGSSSAMSNATGQLVETTEHQPYGAVRFHTGTEASNYNFTGQEADPESGLYNYNARLYDPATGMFISADTVVPDYSDPQSLNRYMYCRGNPLVYVDPSGNFWEIIVGALIGGVIGGTVSEVTGGDFSDGFIAGAITGGFMGGASGIIGGMGGSASVSAVTQTGIYAAAGMGAGAINAGISGSNIGIGALTGGAFAFGAYALPAPGLKFFTEGPKATFANHMGGIANRMINSSLTGAAFGATYAGMTGGDMLHGAAMGAAAWAAGSAGNMLIGNAVGFIGSGFNAPTYENGMYVYEGNSRGALTIGNAVWGPNEAMPPMLASHEFGHGKFQSNLLGPLYLPLHVIDQVTFTHMFEYSPSLLGGAPTYNNLYLPSQRPWTWWQ